MLVLSLLAAGLLTGSGTAPSSTPPTVDPAPPALVLVADDYPDYPKEIGRLTLDPAPPPGVLAQVEPRFLRLALADIETTPHLPTGLVVYQTVSTDRDLPVNLNLVVRVESHAAACFSPDIPYCQGFELLSRWFREAGVRVPDLEEADSLARLVVGLGMATVHRPDSFQYLQLTGKFGLQYWSFMEQVDEIYDAEQAPYRSEAKAREYQEITSRYRDLIHPVSVVPVDGGWRLHGFVFRTLHSSAGELREWTVTVHPDAAIEVETRLLEKGIGETSWPFAP